ncbi:hypothetical protein [Mucilaginibacter sp. FT3.2]|uniref:hypothetical protein n=1 Tax=Mucilaginibacter sp. FT3.2 TaxID=2723090 RepID=UPI001610026F|nr:hypothetical protein [Mucilaginibacter sp. FT3.2]MBB6233234.1 hypothetical protein [Mucilaginibacter sp. FT3.2]
MTTKSIEEQIAAIKAVTSKANESKETAMAFLKSAGIITIDAVKGGSAKLASTTKTK